MGEDTCVRELACQSMTTAFGMLGCKQPQEEYEDNAALLSLEIESTKPNPRNTALEQLQKE